MAKKQPANPTSRAVASPSKASPAPKSPPPPQAEPFQVDAIGRTAGKVWGILLEGPQSLAALKKAVAVSPDLVVAAVGWLAREDKLCISLKGRTVMVALTDELH